MKKGLKRDTIDKFYTKSNIVLECLEHIDKYFEIKDDHIIIEPSAGNGAFLLELETKYPNNKICHHTLCFSTLRHYWQPCLNHLNMYYHFYNMGQK